MSVYQNQHRIRALLLATVFVVPLPIFADQETVSLDELIAELIQNNPQIQAAESKYQAALARPSQERALPDPVVSFVSRNGNGSPIPFTELGKDPLSSVGVMWEQEFPYPGKLKLAGKIAEKEAASVGAEVDTVKWNVITQLKQAFYQYFPADRSLEILSESLDLLKRISEITESRYSVGEGIQQDILRAQVEISILNQRITGLEQERASAAAEINRLLNRPVQNPLPKPAPLTLSPFSEAPEKLEQEYLMKAPVIRSTEAMLQSEKLGLDLAKKQYRPDFMTSIEYANSPDFPDMWEIEFGLRIPIFYKKKQAYGVVEATHNVTRAEKELNTVKQEVSFSIKNEILQIQASERLLKLYGDAIIPQSNLALESSMTSYQVGKTEFLTILSNFMTVLEYRMNYFEELAKHESAIARLEGAMGRQITGNPPSADRRSQK